MIIVVGDTPSSVEINEGGGRIGDPSKMAAAQYVSSNRQRQSMGRLPIYAYARTRSPALFNIHRGRDEFKAAKKTLHSFYTKKSSSVSWDVVSE